MYGGDPLNGVFQRNWVYTASENSHTMIVINISNPSKVNDWLNPSLVCQKFRKNSTTFEVVL
jgi:hypothetical protein